MAGLNPFSAQAHCGREAKSNFASTEPETTFARRNEVQGSHFQQEKFLNRYIKNVLRS